MLASFKVSITDLPDLLKYLALRAYFCGIEYGVEIVQ